ncbi:hypothetical protein BaRGS_00014772, partial [Batillaria attramentaria]
SPLITIVIIGTVSKSPHSTINTIVVGEILRKDCDLDKSLITVLLVRVILTPGRLTTHRGREAVGKGPVTGPCLWKSSSPPASPGGKLIMVGPTVENGDRITW